MKRIIPICILMVMAFCLVFAVQAQEGEPAAEKEKAAAEEPIPGKSDTLKWAEENFHYIGEKKCRMCHREHFTSWEETPHAKAWEKLSAEEQKNDECVQCHITGMTEESDTLVNVGCEACHGPGSEYKSKKTMEDAKLAATNGLLPVTEETCVRCHNKKSPTFKGFDYAEALKTGVHDHPEKEEKK